MKIRFFGTGSAFTLKNFQTNLGIERNKKLLLLDAGGDIRFSLKESGLSYKDVNAVYISHSHNDHIGGLEYLAFCRYFDTSIEEKIHLYGNTELLNKIWENSFRGGIESIQGKIVCLDDFFNVHHIPNNGSFEWEGIRLKTVQVIHVMNGFYIVPSYGLFIKPDLKSEKSVFWGSDMQFCPHQIMDFYNQANFIIQDCETSPIKSGVHAHISELIDLPDAVKKKMVLVHYQDNVLDDAGEILEEWRKRIKEAGFYSLVPKGCAVNIFISNSVLLHCWDLPYSEKD